MDRDKNAVVEYIQEAKEAEWNKDVSPTCRKVQEKLIKIASMLQTLEEEEF